MMTTDTPPSTPNIVTGPRGYPVLGLIPRMARDPIKLFMDTAHEHGGLATLNFAGRTIYLVTHPDYVQYVLRDNHHNYVRGASAAAAA